MRSPRMQFTVRWMMAVVGFMALLLSVPTFLMMLEDSTYYAPKYSEAKFRSIQSGMLEADVIRILGEPLNFEVAEEYIEWIYGPINLLVSKHAEPYTIQEPVRSGDPREYTIVIAEPAGEITFASGSYLKVDTRSLVGRNLSEIGSRFGKPLQEIHERTRRYLVFSGTTNDGSYHVRKVGIDAENRVNNIVAGWYID
jgi:hypothetical protein